MPLLLGWDRRGVQRREGVTEVEEAEEVEEGSFVFLVAVLPMG